MSCSSRSAPSTTSAASSGTPPARARAARAAGSRACTGRCSRRPERQTVSQLAALHEVSKANRRLYRAFLLKQELRLLYQLEDRSLAEAHLRSWLAWASRSRLRPFVKLARTIRRYRDGILAAIRLGLSNSRMEALNSNARLLSHPSFGFHSPEPLIALIYLCRTGLTIEPPLR